MTAALIPTPVMQFLDADGNPLVGGKVYTYAAGTSTPLATYTDYGGATPNANPVILNSRGEASIWFGTAAYKLELYTAATVLIWTADNVSASTPVVYGTGVAAALAINVGTAGSILVNGGVLGTPSSGLVTNLTGTASININGTVGATTANTGAFTTLSASGTSTMAAINATTFTTSGRVSLGNASNSTASGPTLKIDGSGSGSDQIAIYEASADKWHINSSTGVLGLYNIATSSYAATISAANVFAIAGAATVGTTLSVAGASLVVGSSTFNQSEWTVTGTTIQASSSAFGGFSLASSRADADGVRLGAITWDFLTNTATYQNRAYIEVQTNGSTANKRGGNLIFGAAADNATAPTIVATIASTGLSVTGTLGVTGVSTLTGGATIGTGSNVLGLKVAYLTADSQLNSSTTLTTLSDLTVAIGAGETWLIEWKLRVGANLEATGLGLAVDTPASATQDVFYQYIPSALDLISGVYTGPAMVQSTTTDAARVDWTAAEIVYGGRAIVTVSARVTASGAGNVLMQFAQETSTATTLIVYRGSSMKAQRVT